VERGYELIEHTADVGVVGRGPTLAAAFAAAAEGMYAVMVDLADVREREQRPVQVNGEDLGQLLTHWLVDLIFLTQSEGLLFSRFEVAMDGERALRATAYGERLDLARHALGAEVKAVTRHRLSVMPVEGGYETRVIFDI